MEIDELICDVFELYKEIEIINRENLENGEEENN